jgi:p24 family protein delta-1
MRFKYSIEPDHQGVLHATLNSPQRTQLWSKNGAVKSSYATSAQMAGEHSVCFSNVGTVQLMVDFSFESGADAENDYADVAKKENLKPVEIELRRMEDTVKHIRSEMTYMRTREEQMRNTNGTTFIRVLKSE